MDSRDTEALVRASRKGYEIHGRQARRAQRLAFWHGYFVGVTAVVLTKLLFQFVL